MGFVSQAAFVVVVVHTLLHLLLDRPVPLLLLLLQIHLAYHLLRQSPHGEEVPTIDLDLHLALDDPGGPQKQKQR